jgi:5S rRNA maturation endonuclease (ribonuclease M5)
VYIEIEQMDAQMLMKVILLFDEDHSGEISRDEFYRTLIFCQVNGEEHPEVLLNGVPKLKDDGGMLNFR